MLSLKDTTEEAKNPYFQYTENSRAGFSFSNCLCCLSFLALFPSFTPVIQLTQKCNNRCFSKSNYSVKEAEGLFQMLN